MDNIILNVYDDDKNLIKSCTATDFTIKFGAIRSLMKLLDVENIEDTGELLKVVYRAWGELTKILNKCFPDMTEDDWDNVDLPELIPVILQIIKSVSENLLTIPKDSKN